MTSPLFFCRLKPLYKSSISKSRSKSPKTPLKNISNLPVNIFTSNEKERNNNFIVCNETAIHLKQIERYMDQNLEEILKKSQIVPFDGVFSGKIRSAYYFFIFAY